MDMERERESRERRSLKGLKCEMEAKYSIYRREFSAKGWSGGVRSYTRVCVRTLLSKGCLARMRCFDLEKRVLGPNTIVPSLVYLIRPKIMLTRAEINSELIYF